jgi:hypothetical protein
VLRTVRITYGVALLLFAPGAFGAILQLPDM